MRLSELIGTLSPSTYTLLALVIFVGIFAGVAYRTFRPSARAEQERINRLPLEGSDD